MKRKNIIIFLYIMSFVFSFFDCAAIVSAGEEPIRSFYKTDYINEDVISKGLDPNVLFLLDTSTAMTFAPWGIMPNANDGRSFKERAEMLKDSTYGHGMRPPLFDGVETTYITGGDGASPSTSYNRYGRDLDASNNYIGNADCYYTSDPDKPFLLTFKNRHLAHYNNWIDSEGKLTPPNLNINGDLSNLKEAGALTNADITEINEVLSSLTDFIPSRYEKDENGNWIAAAGFEKPAVPLFFANQFLVPNDSRLYKMKLALWRLTGQGNINVLSRINLAAAITYQDIDTSIYGISVATKNARPGAGEGHRDYYGATTQFPFGNAASYITGEYNTTKDIEGVDVEDSYMSQKTKRGVWIDIYQKKKIGDNMWNALSRSIMYVPFNKLYDKKAEGNMEGTSHLDDFRSYISGYEHYKGLYNANGDLLGPAAKPIKDEFWATSLTLLSTAIYGGRDASEGGYFPFHKGKRITDSYETFQPTGEYMIQFAVEPKDNAGSTKSTVIYLDKSTNSEGLPTGQAVGSVLDFFSPPTTGLSGGADGVNFADNSVGFFPVTGSCQQNWLVVFCAGNNAISDYPPDEAVRRLFNRTRIMRGRRFDGSKWVEQNYEMDSGVRTIVVGFLPDEKVGEEPEIAKVRADLKAMAKAGDPILTPEGDYIDNPDATPEIANDVPGLVKALNNVLKRLNVAKMGSGAVSMLPRIDNITDPNTRVVFGAAYKINPLDQWNGWLAKYRITDSASIEQWEANNSMVNKGLDRALYTSTGARNSTVLDVSKVNPEILVSLAGIPEERSQRFSKWLLDYEHSSSTTDSIGILGDMVNSGITVVGKPRHQSLTDNGVINSREAVVYVQTNRGVLHALNYMNGNEVWGFIPPNIFQNKLKNLKFDKNEFIDGNGLTRVRSNPMVLLDGTLIAKDVEYQNAARTLLTGYLGYGGNGFYTMDITEMDASPKPPVFRWAVENARYGAYTAANTTNDTVRRWGVAASDYGDYNYWDLGLTIVPGVCFTPVAGGRDTVGVLPGGLGHRLGVGDSQGKAFYIFNPANGAILQKIDEKSNANTGFIAPNGVKLGMGISPIIYHENDAKKTVAFYTADSEGNIMKCNLEGASIPNWKLESMFQLRTLGTPFENGVGVPPAGGLAVAVPRKMVLAKSKNNYTWLFGGTSDLYVPGSDVSDSKKLINKEHYMFGLNTNNLLKSDKLGMGINPSDVNVRKMPYYIDDIPEKYGKYGRTYDDKYDEEYEINKISDDYGSHLGITHGMSDYGWLLRLRPKFGMTEAEYLSADPYLFNNVIYIATFIPIVESISEEVCRDIGVGKLYALDPSTGRSVMWQKPGIVLENIKIVGIVGNPAKNSLILSVKELVVDAKDKIKSSFSGSLDIGNGLIEVDAPGGSIFDPSGFNPTPYFEELVPHTQYWNERFK